MTSNRQGGRRDDAAALDQDGGTAAERAGGAGAGETADDEEDTEPATGMGGAGSGGTGQVSPAAANTVGGAADEEPQ